MGRFESSRRGDGPSRRIWAVVPVKELSRAKSRLSALLERDERRHLALAMLDDVLAALKEVEALSRILVVSRDRDAAALAAKHGAEALSEPPDGGQNGAVRFAAGLARRAGAGTILVIPADVPLLDAKEVSGLLKHHRASPAVTIVPDRHGRGTNALACSPPDVLPFQFGEQSFSAHIKAAQEACVKPSILSLPSLALDIDTPEDTALLENFAGDLSTLRYLNALKAARTFTKRS